STLISIASASISNELGLGPEPQVDGAGWLDQAGATFVTLLRAGALRGCIGSLEAVRPIGADVADNALGAAFRDPRFPALKRVQCDLCPRDCRLHVGQRGMCFVRKMEGGRMVLTTYGRSSGFCIDPVEKKPLNHFYPGTSILSFGTAGCNLACKFCQNWDISK